MVSSSSSETITDLECGGSIHQEEEDDIEAGSCYSQFYNSNEEEEEDSFSSDCSVVQITHHQSEAGIWNHNKRTRHCCRICQLSTSDDENEELMDLGCCCKDDLAVAHKHCAHTWFKIKGNKICEICNSIVTNLVVPNETPSTTQGTMDVNPAATTVAATRMSTATRRGRGCINGHRLLNFILACLVFAFVISWLFHFSIPS